MCGRVRVPEDYSELEIDLRRHELMAYTFTPRWNVPPTEIRLLRARRERPRRCAGEGQYEIATFH